MPPSLACNTHYNQVGECIITTKQLHMHYILCRPPGLRRTRLVSLFAVSYKLFVCGGKHSTTIASSCRFHSTKGMHSGMPNVSVNKTRKHIHLVSAEPPMVSAEPLCILVHDTCTVSPECPTRSTSLPTLHGLSGPRCLYSIVSPERLVVRSTVKIL